MIFTRKKNEEIDVGICTLFLENGGDNNNLAIDCNDYLVSSVPNHRIFTS